MRQAAEIILVMDYLNSSHTCQVALLPLTPPMESQGNRLTLGAEHDTKTEKQGVKLGPFGLGMVLNHRNQAS